MMTTFFDGLLPLLLQVTLWISVGLVALAIVNRYRPERLSAVALGLFIGIIGLSILAFVPWPGWLTAPVGQEPPALVSATATASHDEVSGQAFSFSVPWQNWLSVLQLPKSASSSVTAWLPWNGPFWLLTLLCTGIALGAMRLAVAYRYTRWHVAQAEEVSDTRVQSLFVELAVRFNLRCKISLLSSATLQVPATVGYWKPVVLLPKQWSTWSQEECRTVLAHELAHIRRADFLVMVMAQCIALVYWFHPLVRRLSRWLVSGQELAADALAVQVHGDQRTYLQSLCRLALYQDGARLPAPARLFLSPEVSLVRRIAMLREERQWLPGKRWAGGLVVCLFAGLGVLLATLRSGADEPKQSVNTSSGTDWRKYVDAKAPGYMIVRPSVALDLPSMEQFRKELNRVFKDEIDVLPGRRGMGVNLDQVECFAGPLQISLQKNNEKGTGVMTVRGQFFRLKTADAAEQWIKHCTASCEKVQHASGTYYRVNHQDKTAKGDILSGSYLLRPDEQTIVFAQTEQEVLSWLSGKESEKANWLAACPEDSGIMTTIVDVKSELVQGMIRQGGFADNKNPVFAPVLTHEGGIACTIEAKDQIHMQFTFGCGNAESAAKKKPQLEAMLSMGKLMLGKEEPEGVEQAKAEFNVLKDLINNLKTTTEGSQVMINTHSSMKLEGVLKQQISELLGPRVK